MTPVTLDQLRSITTTVVNNRRHLYKEPAMDAEVAARVTHYILGIVNRHGPDEMQEIVREQEVVMDVLEQVLGNIESGRDQPDPSDYAI